MNVREFASKNSMALLYATAGLVVILLAVWALPFHSRGVGSWCGGMGERGNGRFDRSRAGEYRQEYGQRATAPSVDVQATPTDESVPDYGSPAPVQQ